MLDKISIYICILCVLLLVGCSAKTNSSAETQEESFKEMESVSLTESEKNNPEYIYFDEALDIPVPDSCIDGVTFKEKKSDSGMIQYTYNLNKDESVSNKLLNEYTAVLYGLDAYTVDIQNDVIYVLKDDTLISAMMAGYDNDTYFLMVTFQG